MSHTLSFPCNVSYAEYKRRNEEYASIREQPPLFSGLPEIGNLWRDFPLVNSEILRASVCCGPDSQVYLCVNLRDDSEASEYIIAETSRCLLGLALNGILTLREVVVCSRRVFLAGRNESGEVFCRYDPFSAMLDLPAAAGQTLVLDEETKENYLGRLRKYLEQPVPAHS